MIWWNLALFVVSFVLTALLAPKPKIENARPETIDNLDFPRATEDAPVPLVLGDVWIKAPNTIWYGNFRNEPITEKIKVSLFKKKTIIKGYKYYLSLNLALCLGFARLAGIRIDDADVSDGGDILPGYRTATTSIDFAAGTATHNPPDSDNTFDLILAGYNGDDIDDGGFTVTVTANYTYSADPSFEFVTIKVIAKDASMTNIGASIGIISAPNGQPAGSYVLTDTFNIPVNTRYLVITGVYNALVVSDITIDSNSAVVYGNTEIVSYGGIFEPELFGGPENGGGWIGNYVFYFGGLNQDVDSNLTFYLGAGNVPAYNGVAHIVMPDHYIGESVNLRKIAFRVQSYSNNLALPNDGKIGTDINPAEAMVEILTNKWRGIGKSVLRIDTTSFYNAGVTLYNEGLGISIQVTSPQNGKELIREILRHIDGILFDHPITGLLTLRLIRDDYDEGTLPVYDASDIISVENFTRTTWEDVYSQVKVSYQSRDKDSTITAVAQDMAVANSSSDGLKTSQVSFPFCYEASVANKLAARELSQLSVPIFKMSLAMNRNGYGLLPGDVFKISWPEYGIVETVLRVGFFDSGALLDNRLVVDCAQDIFAVSDVVFGDPEPSLWADETGERPAPVTEYEIIDIPKAVVEFLDIEVPDGQGFVVTLPIRPALTTPTYLPYLGVETGVLDYVQEETTFPLYFELTSEIDILDGFEDGVIASITAYYDATLGDIDIPSDANPFYQKGLIYANGEWMGFDSISNDGVDEITVTNLYRGLLGTLPVTHLIGTKFIIFDFDSVGEVDISTELMDDANVYFKFATRNASTVRDVSDDDEESFLLSQWTSSPARPRDVQIEGLRTGISLSAAQYVNDVTWVSGDRFSFEKENDSAGSSGEPETYNIDVYDIDTDTVVYSDTGVTSPLSLDFEPFESTVLGEVRIYSNRTSDSRDSILYGFVRYSFVTADVLLLSGDEQSGSDAVLLSGDEQSGGDREVL
jgi:hypothetical protein